MSESASTSAIDPHYHFSDFHNQVLKGLTAGVLSAAVTKTSIAPIDRVKLVLQLQNGANTSLSISRHHYKYKGIVDCFQTLAKEQGLRSLWRGNSATIARIIPNNILNLAFRDYFRIMFLSGVNRKQQCYRFYAGNVAAGGAGGAVTLFFVYPLDFIRTRLAVGSKDRMLDCFKTIYGKEGVVGLYRGFLASLYYIIASRAMFFGIFDSIRLTITEESNQQPSFLITWLLAQASIIVSSLVCYPLDTVRRKLMMESGEKVKTHRNTANCNSLKCTSGALILALYYEALKLEF